MRIFVTGATGFVGKALVERLVALGHDVGAVSRDPRSARERLGIHEVYSWDELSKAFDSGFDAVVHLAGESVKGLWTQAKADEVWNSRIWTSEALVEAITQSSQRPGVLVSASGIGFYGDAGEEELDEQSGAGDDYFARLCVEWEALILSADLPDVRVACARFGIVLGPGGGALALMVLPAKTGLSGPLGSGRQWWSWVSLEDAVSALVHMVQNSDVQGPVNVVAPQPIRQSAFQKTLCAALSRPSFIPTPAFGVRMLLGRFAEEVLASKRVKPTVLKNTRFEWADSELAAVFHRLLASNKTSLILPMLAAFALLAAPYGKTPHVIDEISMALAGEGTLAGYAHAGFHCIALPWFVAAAFFRSL